MSTVKRNRLNPFQHALKRPDTYIGSAKTVTSNIWIFDDEEKIAVQKKIANNSGLFNIVREILSNAIDNVWRSKEECPETPVKKIEMTISTDTGEISIWNDGYPIRVRQEESEYTEPRTNKTITENLYPAELFFGDMFTGTNYDDGEVRKTSGRNGMGAKTTNVFSKEFKVECFCPEDKTKFFQMYHNNGTERDQPVITKLKNKTGYTLISFTPDYEFFKYPNSSEPGIDKNFISLLKLYAYEVSMITGVMVKFNVDEESTSVKVNSLEKYARLFYPQIDKNKMTTFHSPSGDDCVLVEGDEPELDASETISQISFVNGIRTKSGGVHVETWKDSVIPAIVRAFNSRKSKITKEKVQVKTTAKEVYPYLHMFIRVEVDRPVFSSQTKDEFAGETEEDQDNPKGYKIFNTRSKKEREEWTKILDTAIKKIMKWNFVFLLEDKLLAKMDRNTSRKEGSSRKVRMGSKATDANEAGGKNSHLCTVYIAEGQSAGAFIGRGISSVPKGQDFNGVYCIKGKFINVQNASLRAINNNEEVQQLKKFLGLRSGIDYSDEDNFKTLRYGKVCILTDADDDGIHIRGLLLNFFYTGYSELLERGYIDSFSTAVASAVLKGASRAKNKKGITTNPGKLLFYSNPEFKKWYCIQESEKIKNMEVEYYKGLGSIDPLDAPKYFSDPKVVTYFMEGDEKEYMELGFNDERSDWRKDWITRDMIKKERLDEEECIEMEEDCLDDELPEEESLSSDFIYEGNLGLSSFIDHQLIIYHKMALRRALPSIWDGFKESQRKILFTIFKRNYTKPRDVESIAGAVKEEAKYHHGSNSCEEAIIKMAQGFVGSNNIPLLSPKGEMGCVDPNTRILIWDGSVKLAKEITISDVLIGDDGSPRKISKIVKGEDDMYRIKQGYGEDYIVNSQHILTLKYSGHKTIKQKSNYWISCYYDKLSNKVKSKSFCFTKSEHYNSSKISSEEAKHNLEDFLKDIPDDWNVFDINIQDYLSFPSHVKDKCKGIKNKKSIKWDKRDVPIDPYILGMWLGDGNGVGRGFTTADPEMVKEWVIWSDKIGAEVVHYKNEDDHENYTYGLRRRGTRMGNGEYATSVGSAEHSSSNCIGCQTSSVSHPACDWVYEDKTNESSREYDWENVNDVKRDDFNPFIILLKKNNLYKNKHIPKEYIINDEETRLKLLAGFIDTDGSVKHMNGTNYVAISQEKEKHGHMIDGLQYIARSLGFRAEVEERKCTRKNGEFSIMKELVITGSDFSRIPTKIPHKKLEDNNRKIDRICCSVTVSKVDRGEYIGWHIDGNERFLLGDFTITHNTRHRGGKDHAAARYPKTMAEEITKIIFNAHDEPLLERLMEDNEPVEYKFFIPIIPTILINGAHGIATGFYTEIPCYNPLEIVKWIELWLNGESSEAPELVPWYRGFNGPINLVKSNSGKTIGWKSKGILEKGKEKGWWDIRDLPIGVWTDNFKEWLEYLETGTAPKDKKWKKREVRGLSDLKSYCTPNTVHFMIKPTKDFIPDMDVPNNLKVMQKLKSFKNMVVIDENDYPHRFDSPEEILQFFCPTRLKYYALRKNYILKILRKDLLKAMNRYRFVKGVKDKNLDLYKSEEELEKILSETPWKFDKVESGQNKELSYDYLLSMQMRSMTVKKLEELKREKEKLIGEIEILESKSFKDLWKEDLQRFKVAYAKFLKTRCEE